MTRVPAGPASLLASLPATLGGPLAPPELLLIGWTDAEPDLAVTVALNLDETVEPPDELRACRQLIVDGAEQAAVVVALPAERSPRTWPTADSLARFAAACCSRYGLNVLDAVTVVGGRWRSVGCTNPACCPPEGNPMPEPVEPPAGLPWAEARALKEQIKAATRPTTREDTPTP